MKKPILCVLAAALVCALSSGASAQSKAVIAVFDIETQGVELGEDMLGRLSDYLGSRMAATGSYQVVPREQIRERLVEQKKDSYGACFDQSCQIEIGKELAAEKSLATKLIKLGSRCTVTATLYDLRKAATENAATLHGGCTEDDIVTTLDKVVDKLHGKETEAPAEEKKEVVEAPREKAPPRGGAETHDTFFVRVAVGAGFGVNTVRDRTEIQNKLQGAANISSVAIGYVVAENFALHGSFFHAVMINPDSYSGDTVVEDVAGRYLATGLGAGVTYYFMPLNLYISGSVALTILEARIGPFTFSTETGVGGDLVVGKEWWITDNLGLGVAVQALFSAVPSNLDTTHTSFGAGVLCSLTYN